MSTIFTTIQTDRRRLADEVYDQIVKAIMHLEIGPEDRLVQEKIATQLQISRTPVREALMRLEQEGVLEISGRGGFRLHKADDQEVRELYQAREAIEGQSARLLAEAADKQIYQKLRETVQRIENTEPRTTREYFEANRSIHRSFVELAGNRYLTDMFDAIWGKAMVVQVFATLENVDISRSLRDHMVLVEALAGGDKSVALDTFVAHIRQGLVLQLQGLHARQAD